VAYALTNAGTADKIEFVTAVASVTFDWSETQIDKLVADTSPTSAKTVPANGTVAGAATTKVTTDVASLHEALVKAISIVNTHATLSGTVQLQHTINGGTARKITPLITLAPGEKIEYSAEGVWFVYDADMGVRMGGTGCDVLSRRAWWSSPTPPRWKRRPIPRARSCPGLQHRHPATAKMWGMATVAANVPTLQASYGVASITDSATGQILFTFTTAFSSTNYAVQCNSEYTATTYAVANDRKVAVRNGTRATGSVALDCIDSTATTNLKADPATWFIMANGDQ
jgi:hypothetical protein